MKVSEHTFKLFRLPIDFFMATLAFLVAYQLRSVTDLIPGIQLPINLYTFPSFDLYIKSSLTMALSLVLLFAVGKFYSFQRSSKLGKQFIEIISLTTLWLFLIFSYYFIARTFPFSRLVLIFAWLFSWIFICFGRTILHFIRHLLIQKGYFRRKVLIIGKNNLSNLIQESLTRRKYFEIVEVLENFDDLEKILAEKPFEEIIQTKERPSALESRQILDFCREHHLEYSFVPDLIGMQQTNIEVSTISGIPIIHLKPTPLKEWGRIWKRVFDLFGSTLGLIILSPFFLVIAILIKIDDQKGHVFYTVLDNGERVKRVGEKGKLFNFFKFRTMVPNSHNLRYKELLTQNIRGDGKWNEKSPLVKIKNDPRITKIGKFLRKTSIDELPQLINVFKGNMSLVGPRPHLPEEVAKYQKHHKFVLTIKPGITGLSAISGRSDLDFEDEVRLETYYIENWSIWLDIKILFKTIFIVFKKYEE